MNYYQKIFKTYQEQIKMLRDKNLIIQDEKYLLTKLQNIGYYRLSTYFIPFKNENNLFREKTYSKDIQRETKRSKEPFVIHFKEKYKTDDLPIWTVVKKISFGTLSQFYKLLHKNVQKEVVGKIDIKQMGFTENWHNLEIWRDV